MDSPYIYIYILVFSFGVAHIEVLQRIWDKTRRYYQKIGEHVGKPVNVMRTHLEFMKTTKILKTQHCPQSPKEKKENGPLVHDDSLTHWLPTNFYAYFCSLPFWA